MLQRLIYTTIYISASGGVEDLSKILDLPIWGTSYGRLEREARSIIWLAISEGRCCARLLLRERRRSLCSAPGGSGAGGAYARSAAGAYARSPAGCGASASNSSCSGRGRASSRSRHSAEYRRAGSAAARSASAASTVVTQHTRMLTVARAAHHTRMALY